MSAFYNENDPKAAAWLRELIAAGHIAPGIVDERSIKDLNPTDLDGFTQCHFFAGIGGWSLALRLAGVSDHEPIWTGSCPCQPFSDAGKRKAKKDPRHLWPAWFPLIQKCGPATILGEQVASRAALRWLDGVFANLEGADYACAAADLCAAGVNAPHIRQRLWWVAESTSEQRQERGVATRVDSRTLDSDPAIAGLARRLADPAQQHRPGLAAGDGRIQRGPESDGRGLAGGCGSGGMDLSDFERRETGTGTGTGTGTEPQPFWANATLLPCIDGKARRIEPGTFPLAHGIPGRVGLLRGYGNAIVPEVAAVFIRAFYEARSALIA